MVTNRTQGPVQVFDNSVAAINLALMDLYNRSDIAKGLRGRAMVYDQIRADDPTVASDVVTLGVLQSGTAFSSIGFFLGANTPLYAQAPGTTYTELAAPLRQQVNFAAPQELEARVIVEGWGTESGSGKGVALTTSAGSVICQVTWNGASEGKQVGSFTAVSVTTDQLVYLKCKGSSASESLILQSVTLDLRFSVDVLTM